MAELIAIGSTTTSSADFTLADGQSTTLFLKDATGDGVALDAVAQIQIKSSAGDYFNIGTLDAHYPARVLQAPGTFRVFKFGTASAFGVDRV